MSDAEFRARLRRTRFGRRSLADPVQARQTKRLITLCGARPKYCGAYGDKGTACSVTDTRAVGADSTDSIRSGGSTHGDCEGGDSEKEDSEGH
jgi:hypothetical protein